MHISIPYLFSILLCGLWLRAESQSVPVVIYDGFAKLQTRFEEEKAPVLVVNFWATWCGPCVEELPHFERLQKDYASSGVKVLLVSMDLPTQKDQRLIPFLQKNKIDSEVCVLADSDADTWIPLMDPNWDGQLPATFIIKGNTKTSYLSNFETFGELEALVRPFLKVGTSAPTASRQR
jgi:thiol-disulfide isomerase/thioredoxin